MSSAQSVFTATLVADGSSDRALVPIIELVLDQHCPGLHREPGFVEHYPSLVHSLADRIQYSLDRYPCDVLFVHRDAESEAPEVREGEIRSALANLPLPQLTIEVIPVRMTEAWLLVDERAIRLAVGNPTGRDALGLPSVKKIESVDAKQYLFDAIKRASGLGLRRTKRLLPEIYRHRVAEYLDDLALLRRLPSFVRFEHRVRDHFDRAAAYRA